MEIIFNNHNVKMFRRDNTFWGLLSRYKCTINDKKVKLGVALRALHDSDRTELVFVLSSHFIIADQRRAFLKKVNEFDYLANMDILYEEFIEMWQSFNELD